VSRNRPARCSSKVGECLLDELAHRMSFASRQNIIVRFVLLQDQPHPFSIITRMAPVSFGIKIAEKQSVLKPVRDRGDRTRDFPCDESFPSDRAFVVKQDAV
jgi:hypothetical protein